SSFAAAQKVAAADNGTHLNDVFANEITPATLPKIFGTTAPLTACADCVDPELITHVATTPALQLPTITPGTTDITVPTDCASPCSLAPGQYDEIKVMDDSELDFQSG